MIKNENLHLHNAIYSRLLELLLKESKDILYSKKNEIEETIKIATFKNYSDCDLKNQKKFYIFKYALSTNSINESVVFLSNLNLGLFISRDKNNEMPFILSSYKKLPNISSEFYKKLNIENIGKLILIQNNAISLEEAELKDYENLILLENSLIEIINNRKEFFEKKYRLDILEKMIEI